MNHRRSTSGRRRGSASGRGGRPRRRVAQALAVWAVFAAGTHVHADWVRFDNPPGPGEFQWRGPLEDMTWLNITKPASDQTAPPSGPGSIGQVETKNFGALVGHHPTAELGLGGVQDAFLVEVSVYLAEPPMEIPVPGVDAWGRVGFVRYHSHGSELPESIPTYIAARFDPGDGLHYGWIGVVRDGTGLAPFAWGYDTEPVPEPATLAILAFGAALVGGRRRGR